ncbi:MAG: flagellar hook-basal body complex protein FliE [Lachnospiraceae bacterium]|nr:flagellar hook-basal body complex protein FliE [Lachnospiraceae bacterium]
MSAYIQSLDSITAQKIASTLEQTSTTNDNSFAAFFDSAIQLLNETNDLQTAAEAEELNMALGYAENAHDLTTALTKAELAITYTVAIKNKVLEAYREIMNIQI